VSILSSLRHHLFGGFQESARSVGMLSVLGLLIGLALVAVADLLHAHETIYLTILEHVGMGFIVAAIAVFGYEWRSHSKITLELSSRLTSLLVATGKEALDRALDELIPTENRDLPAVLRGFSQDCRSVILAISSLALSTRRLDHHYASFLAGLHRSIVKQNADGLLDLQAGRLAMFQAPDTGAVLADEILAAQMRATQKQECYQAISDLASWKDKKLDDFLAASVAALKRGVHIQRIFNITDAIVGSFGTSDEAVLRRHLELAQQWKPKRGRPGYEVRLYGPSERSRSNRALANDLDHIHVGIFCIDNGEKVRYEVAGRDLSNLLIAKNSVSRMPIDFEHLWSDSTYLTQSTIDELNTLSLRTRTEVTAKTSHQRNLALIRTLGRFLTRQIDEVVTQAPEVRIASTELGDGPAAEGDTVVLEKYAEVVLANTGTGAVLQRAIIPQFREAQFSDLLLTSYMQRLQENNTYLAISELAEWQGERLGYLRQETESAVRNRGVNVRRVLHALREETTLLSKDDILAILNLHLSDSQRWSQDKGRYEVRYFGRSELVRAYEEPLADKPFTAFEDFGLFTIANVMTRFRSGDWQRGREVVATRDASKDLDLFERLWNHSTPLDQKIILKAAEDLQRTSGTKNTRQIDVNPTFDAAHA
jgi:hypothetical protein